MFWGEKIRFVICVNITNLGSNDEEKQKSIQFLVRNKSAASKLSHYSFVQSMEQVRSVPLLSVVYVQIYLS